MSNVISTSNRHPLQDLRELSRAVRRMRDFASRQWLQVSLAVIVAVSLYDTYLVYAFRDFILMDERNPICWTLISYDPQSLTWFFLGKTMGNCFVIAVLVALCAIKYRHRKVVAASVAMFQILLLTYLTFSDHTTGVLDFDGILSCNSRDFENSLTSLTIHVAVTLAVGFSIVGIRWRTRYLALTR